jgi:hypothetical protein
VHADGDDDGRCASRQAVIGDDAPLHRLYPLSHLGNVALWLELNTDHVGDSRGGPWTGVWTYGVGEGRIVVERRLVRGGGFRRENGRRGVKAGRRGDWGLKKGARGERGDARGPREGHERMGD